MIACSENDATGESGPDSAGGGGVDISEIASEAPDTEDAADTPLEDAGLGDADTCPLSDASDSATEDDDSATFELLERAGRGGPDFETAENLLRVPTFFRDAFGLES